MVLSPINLLFIKMHILLNQKYCSKDFIDFLDFTKSGKTWNEANLQSTYFYAWLHSSGAALLSPS